MTTMRTDVVCASCRNHKFKLTAKKSRLKTDQVLLLCDTCIKQKFEPRWIVMMVGRSEGFDAIKDYIKPQRYIGDPIMLEDMI